MPIDSDRFLICHSVPGRMRLKWSIRRFSRETARALEQRLGAGQPLLRIEVRHTTGSIILHYDSSKVEPGEALSHLAKVLHQEVAEEAQRTLSQAPRSGTASLSGQALNAAALSGFMGYLAAGRLMGKSPIPQGPFSLTGLAAALGAIPLLRRAWEDFRGGKRISLFTFLAAACGIAIVAGQALTAFEIIWVLSVGMLLESAVTERAKRAIRDVLQVTPREGIVLLNGAEKVLPIAEIRKGDTVLARTGDRIPVDGEVLDGEALVDESHITGSSQAELRTTGHWLYAGTRVEQGTLTIRADKVGRETYLLRVTEMVEASLSHRGQVEQRADVLAARLARAGTVATIAALALTRSFSRALSVMLVMACPCATLLAASTAIAAAIANAARRQILVKGGPYLEGMNAVDVVCFDKTGTITVGLPEVVEIVPESPETEAREVLALAARAERASLHPLAKSLVDRARREGLLPEESPNAEELVGRGVKALLDSHVILVGKRGFLEKEGVDVSSMGERAEASMAEGKTVIYVSKGGRLHGIIALSSALHPEAALALSGLRAEGFAKASLVSGDSEPVVAAVARRLGFDEYRAALLPDQKARYVESLETRGSKVLMVGDGVNDALALSKATVGVAMGAGGSEVAMEAADITLVKSDLMGLVVLRRLSRVTLRTIEQNFWIATATNVLGIVLSLGGWLLPLTAGALHIAHTLGIMLNSSRLLKWDPGASSEGPPPE